VSGAETDRAGLKKPRPVFLLRNKSNERALELNDVPRESSPLDGEIVRLAGHEH
jgi:hypothetical protein